MIVEGYRKRTQEQSEGTLTLEEFIKVCATVHAEYVQVSLSLCVRCVFQGVHVLAVYHTLWNVWYVCGLYAYMRLCVHKCPPSPPC